MEHNKTNSEMKGITFVPKNNVSISAIKKIEKLMELKKERIEKLVVDYNTGKFATTK